MIFFLNLYFFFYDVIQIKKETNIDLKKKKRLHPKL